MTVDSVLDTNVLVYAVSQDASDYPKSERAYSLLDLPSVGLPVQVLHEFYAVSTRKIDVPLTGDEALAWIARFRRYPTADLTADIVEAGGRMSHRYDISYWDGAILAAAKAMGASTVYSEDLNAGQVYDGVRVVNPF